MTLSFAGRSRQTYGSNYAESSNANRQVKVEKEESDDEDRSWMTDPRLEAKKEEVKEEEGIREAPVAQPVPAIPHPHYVLQLAQHVKQNMITPFVNAHSTAPNTTGYSQSMQFQSIAQHTKALIHYADQLKDAGVWTPQQAKEFKDSFVELALQLTNAKCAEMGWRGNMKSSTRRRVQNWFEDHRIYKDHVE